MTISTHIKPRVVDNKAIVLTVAWNEMSIKVYGSTMRMGSSPTTSYDLDARDHVTLYPEEGKDGIVAIVVVKRPSSVQKHRGETSYNAAFLKVTWKEKDGQKYPFIDLDEPWIPTNRVGQVTNNTIEVLLPGGKRFCSTDKLRYSNEKNSLPSLVPDGNLLCKYLFGEASALDVVHAAVEHKLEPTLRKRVEQLNADFGAVLSRQTALKRENDCLMDAAAAQFEKSRALLARCDKLQEAINAGNWLWTALNTLPTKIQPKWFKSFKKKLEEYHRLREVQLY